MIREMLKTALFALRSAFRSRAALLALGREFCFGCLWRLKAVREVQLGAPTPDRVVAIKNHVRRDTPEAARRIGLRGK
jgi:hypothetical protein